MAKITGITILCLLLGPGLRAQGPSGDGEAARAAVKKVVETFFEGFHKRDSALIYSTVAEDAVLRTTGRDAQGKTLYHGEDFQKFIQSIITIPDSLSFEERLTSFSIQVDRTLAHAWVGYEFWWNGSFSHCGFNSFEMVNFDGRWKIVHLIDTRGKDGCQD